MIRTRSISFALLLGLALAALSGAARADTMFDVTLDVSNLFGAGNTYGAGGPYSLDFSLTNGNPAQSNTVTISAVMGVTPAGAATTTPGVGAGSDLSTTIVLNNVGGLLFVDFFQGISAGTVLTFHVDATTNLDTSNPAMITPDNFSFSILDSTNVSIPTTDVAANTFFSLDLTPSATVPTGFSSTETPMIGPPTFGLRSVPEPASLGLLVVGLGWTAHRARRRRAA